MTTKSVKMDTYIDHEGPVAERYKWWGVYLVREKRRLQGIAQAVASGTPLAGNSSDFDTHPLPPIRLPEGVETPDELLTRVDAELEIVEALAEMEEGEPEEESKAHGGSVRDEETIPDDITRRKLSGRAALLSKKRSNTGEDF